MDTSILEGLGLTKGEIKVYLTLLELGSTKVGKIIEKSNIASSAVHNSLNTLLEKGLVSYIKKGKIKYYRAVSPKQLIDFIEEKKKNVLEILPELEARQKKEETQEAEIFQGIKGVTTMLNLMIEDTKKGDEYLFFSMYVKEKNKEIQEFFKKYDAKRKAKGLIVKGLAPKELKPLFSKRKALNVRYSKDPMLSNVGVCKNKLVMITWGEKPIGYLIHSKQIADKYKQLFNEIWKSAKK